MTYLHRDDGLEHRRELVHLRGHHLVLLRHVRALLVELLLQRRLDLQAARNHLLRERNVREMREKCERIERVM